MSDLLTPTYSVPVLLADGGIAVIRGLREEDLPSLRSLHERASDTNFYRRFFGLGRSLASAYLDHLQTLTPGSGWGLVAEAGDQLVGLATAEIPRPGCAEISFFVDDDQHGRGLGTLLLEHMAAIARGVGVERFVAEVLLENTAMLRVFIDAGFEWTRSQDRGVVSMTLSTEAGERAVAAADERERAAERRSLEPVLSPSVVAAVGASSRARGVGWEVLSNIIAKGYKGLLYAVHPTASTIGQVPAFPRVSDIPEQVDLVVVAVPASRVLSVVEDAAMAHARGAVVLTAGLGETGDHGQSIQRQTLEIARLHGMRLIGPNCLGLLTNTPQVSLDATFAATSPPAGGLAIGSQSGGVGIAILDSATRVDLGVHSFVSLGNKADVSGNDLLAVWTDEESVAAAALYLESFGNPRKFARLARRFSERKPLIAVVGGSSAEGRRAGASHTAAAAAPSVAVQAMFAQSGVIQVSGVADLVETSRLLLTQPLPSGPRVAICGNAGGIGVLAADRAHDEGLVVPELDAIVVGELNSCAPGAATLANPIDLGAAASARSFGDICGGLLRSKRVDALLVVVAATRLVPATDILVEIGRVAAATPGVPVQIVTLGLPDAPTSVGSQPIPVHGSVDDALRSLGHAVRYASWRAAPRGEPLRLGDDAYRAARALLASWDGRPANRWLAAGEAAALLSTHGIDPVVGTVVDSPGAAGEAAAAVGWPVVVKVAAPNIVHKTDLGLVATGLRDVGAVRSAVAEFQRHRDVARVPVLVQPQVPSGVEMAVGLVRDPTFGPLVMVAAGGVATDVWADRGFLLPPVTDLDVARALRRLRIWPLLDGFRGSPRAAIADLSRLVQSVGQLGLGVPEISELDLNPVIVGESAIHCVDVKLHLGGLPAYITDARRLGGADALRA